MQEEYEMEEVESKAVIHDTKVEITMEEHVTRFLSSNMKIKHYALENGIDYQIFKRKLYQDPRYKKNPRTPSLKPVQIIPVEVEDKIDLSINGYQISIHNMGTLKKVLQVLREV